jgi:hypothetical protein
LIAWRCSRRVRGCRPDCRQLLPQFFQLWKIALQAALIGRLLFCRYGAHPRSDRLEQHPVSDRYKTVTNIMPTTTAPDALSTAFSLMTVDHIRAALKILGTGQVRLMAERGSAWYSNPDRPPEQPEPPAGSYLGRRRIRGDVLEPALACCQASSDSIEADGALAPRHKYPAPITY